MHAAAGVVDGDADIVPGDDVARAGDGAADRQVVAAAVDEEAVVLGERRRAGRVRADVVALDEVAGGAGAEDPYADDAVAGDDVAGACYRSADGEVGGGGFHGDAGERVGAGESAGDIGADVVAFDDGAAGTGA